MAWTYNGIRIYAQESSEATSQIAPRLQPLSGGSVVQSFGYDSTIRNISAIVVGDTNKESLRVLAQDGMALHALVSPEGSLGNWMLKSFKASRTNSTCQTIDIGQPEDAPVYDVELEFWQED